MSTLAEIEAAIKKLSDPQVDQLARWLEALRQRRRTPVPPAVEDWLRHARGAARPGVTTKAGLALTRGEG